MRGGGDVESSECNCVVFFHHWKQWSQCEWIRLKECHIFRNRAGKRSNRDLPVRMCWFASRQAVPFWPDGNCEFRRNDHPTVGICMWGSRSVTLIWNIGYLPCYQPAAIDDERMNIENISRKDCGSCYGCGGGCWYAICVECSSAWQNQKRRAGDWICLIDFNGMRNCWKLILYQSDACLPMCAG